MALKVTTSSRAMMRSRINWKPDTNLNIDQFGKMLSRRIATARPLRSVIYTAQRATFSNHQRHTVGTPDEYPTLLKTEEEDPLQNGGYVNPPFIKRQFRDPHADWWDKQERRNYGEPVHEDHDLLGMFTPFEYTHAKPGKAALQLLTFVAAVFGFAKIISYTYPDKPSAPREFEGGLERELGGPKAVRARAPGDEY